MTPSQHPARLAFSAIVLAALAACGGGGDTTSDADQIGADAGPDAVSIPPIPAPNPDLTFAPAAVELRAGETAAVRVTISTDADLRGARFALPGAQDGITSSFQADEDGHGGTLTVSASMATAPGSKSLMVSGASGVDTTKAWVGAMQVKTVAAALARTLIVDPVAGLDSGDGTAEKPLRTIGKAAAMAASGDTIHLNAGQFTPLVNGEQFPVTLPAGVTLEGTLKSNKAKGTFLSPKTSAENATGLILLGDATVKDLEMDVFGEAISASSGVQSLSNLNLLYNRGGVSVSGTAKTTLRDSEILLPQENGVRAAFVGKTATLSLEQSNAGTDGSNCVTGVSGVIAAASAAVTMSGASFKQIAGNSVYLTGSASGVLGVRVERTLPANCKSKPSIESSGPSLVLTAGSDILNSGGAAPIAIRKSGGTLTVDGTQVVGDGSGHSYDSGAIGIKLDFLSNLLMTRSAITSSTYGIDAAIDDSSMTITNSSFRNRIGINATRKVRVRNTEFRDMNAITLGASSINADLGTVADPGNNSFLRPIGTYDQSQVIELYFVDSSSGTVSAIGNTWNFATQGSDIGGHYNQRTVITGPTPKSNKAKNFGIASPAVKVQL